MVKDNERIDKLANRLCEESHRYEGYLKDDEARFLTILSACVPGEGVLLEIGSYKGKSTIILSKAEIETKGLSELVAVDPLTSPSSTDPPDSDRNAFFSNLECAGIIDSVEFHEMSSQDLSTSWDRPIRLLWIDGDHTYEGVKSDFKNYSPFLIPGGVIAFHDVMHFEGVTNAFAKYVLRSDVFGCAGIVGSIGWAQVRYPDCPDLHRRRRFRLASGLDRHTQAVGRGYSKLNKMLTRIQRWRVPHGPLSSTQFQRYIEISPLKK